MTDITAPKVWLIWSNEHGAFWRPNSTGYTAKIKEAGRYTEDDARARCEGRDKLDCGEPAEILVPAPEAFETMSMLFGLVHRGIDLLANVEYTAVYAEKADAWVDQAKTLIGVDVKRRRRRA